MKEAEKDTEKEEPKESELRDEQSPEPGDPEETKTAENEAVEVKDQEVEESLEDEESEPGEQGEYRVEDVFNQVLGMHLERLMGTRYGIGGLPINVLTLACFILLTEQATMEETADASERFTDDTLVAELIDLGLEVDDNTFEAIEDMIDAGYIEVDEEGGYSPLKPTISMTQLLDSIFPGMPGINLVAYFIQIMDEVESERKDLEYAISQFDQTLRRHAVADQKEKEKKTKRTVKAAPPTPTDWKAISEKIRKGLAEEAQTRKEKGAKLSDLYSPLPTPKPKPATPQPPIQIHTPPSEPNSEETEAETAELIDPGFMEDHVDEAASEATVKPEDEPKGPIGITETGPDESAASEEETESPEGPEVHKKEAAIAAEGLETVETDQPQPSEDTSTNEEERDGPADDQLDEPVEYDDEDLEKEIGAFEEELGSECPICRKGKVQPQTTTKGKLFYRCGNKSCNFISWGKPYHIQCPHCKNPFLVEGADMDGAPILKCPRATCRYWQTIDGLQTAYTQDVAVAEASGPAPALSRPAKKPRKKRVVRRRLVRRKR